MATETPTLRKRYPGSLPFTKSDEWIFFGRDTDIANLATFINIEKTIILYGKSGLGKSSLLNAGVLPKLEEQDKYFIIPLRFGNHIQGDLRHPLDIVDQQLAEFCPQESFLNTIEPEAVSLWQHIKNLEISKQIQSTILMVFDQFEELFTYPKGSDEFAEALAELLYNQMPKNFQRALHLATRNNANLLTPEQYELMERPIDLKVLIAIRSAKLDMINRFSSHIPSILQNCYELKHLSRAQAEEAISEPAKRRGNFESSPFTYQEESLTRMLDYLTRNGEKPIESSQLQILCEYVEENIVIKNEKTFVEPDDLGDLEKVYHDYYDRTIQKIGTKAEQERSRKFIEDGLIFEKEERRISLYEGQIQSSFGISEELLRKIVDTHIIRAQPHSSGGYMYELSHDSLVAPILRAKAQRKEEEQKRKEEEQKRKEEEQKRKEEEQKRKEEEKKRKEKELGLKLEKKEAELKYQRTKWALIASIATVVVLVAIGAYFYTDYYHHEREYVSYYNTFTRIKGIPKGIGPLTLDQVQRRAVSLRFIHKGSKGPLTKMEAVNGRGKLTPQHDVGTYFEPQPKQYSLKRECQWEYFRDSNDNIIYEKAKNKFNKLVWVLLYSPPGEGKALIREAFYLEPEAPSAVKDATPDTAKVTSPGQKAIPNIETGIWTEKRKSIEGSISAHEQGISEIAMLIPFILSEAKIVHIEYSDKGFEKKVLYFDINRNPLKGPDKAFGRKRKFDKEGLELELTSIGRDGDTPMNDEAGNATLKMEYDGLGNLVKGEAFDKNGKKIEVDNGWHIYKAKYDEETGNLIEWAFFGKKGESILHKDGYHKWTGKYDKRGNQVEGAFFGLKGESIFHKDGYHRWTGKYDERGNQAEGAYFGLKGESIFHKDGYHRWTGKYDERGNQAEGSFFGLKGESIFYKDGYHRWTGQYDKRGNQTEWAYFGLKEEPILHRNGYHRVTGQYDERGNRTEWAYFGVREESVLHKNGYHRVTGKYDKRGNQTEWAYFGVREESVLHKNGYHRVTGKYDKRGNQTEWAYFGVKGENILHKDGYHRVTGKYDELGNETELTYFGVKGENILHKDGYHRVTGKYDELGNETELTYFGVKGENILHKDGYHKWTGKYDELGNRTEWAYFGVKGENILHKDGYHRVTGKYDELRNRTEWAYFGVDGEPILGKDGYHRVTGKYDERGNQVEGAYFGVKGAILYKNEYHKFITKYDERGNQTKWAYFGVDGEPILGKDGYHRVTGKYDELGNRTELAYFGVNGEPILDKDESITK